jgi:hypothetical protein
VQEDPGLGEADRQLSENIMAMWTQFARNGNPNVQGLVEWPVYNAAADSYLALDMPLSIKTGFSTLGPITVAPPVPTDRSKIPAYTWEEVIFHIGEFATVTGPIIDSMDLVDL